MGVNVSEAVVLCYRMDFAAVKDKSSLSPSVGSSALMGSWEQVLEELIIILNQPAISEEKWVSRPAEHLPIAICQYVLV